MKYLFNIAAWGIIAVWGVAILFALVTMVIVIGWAVADGVQRCIAAPWQTWTALAGISLVVLGMLLFAVAVSMWALRRVGWLTDEEEGLQESEEGAKG